MIFKAGSEPLGPGAIGGDFGIDPNAETERPRRSPPPDLPHLDNFEGARAYVPAAPPLAKPGDVIFDAGPLMTTAEKEDVRAHVARHAAGVVSFAEEVKAHRAASDRGYTVTPEGLAVGAEIRSGKVAGIIQELQVLEGEMAAQDEAFYQKVDEMLGDPRESSPNKYVGTNAKLSYQLLPPYALALASAAFKLGSVKYHAWNWVDQRVAHGELVGATLRHLEAWLMRDEIDSTESGGSGLPHLAGAIASIMMLADNTVLHPECDDRCPDPDGKVKEAVANLRKLLETQLPLLRAAKAQKAGEP